MKRQLASIIGIAAVLATLSACGFVSTQLTDKANEERLLKPGALDKPLTGYFDTYSVRFLDRYRLMHDWPVVSNCKYSKLPTIGNNQERYKGEIYSADDVYEAGDRTWQRDAHPSSNFDRFVRSQKKQQPIFKSGAANVVKRYEENEEGLQPLCFEAWVETSHTLIFRLHKRDPAIWKVRWSEFNPTGKWSQRQVGSNVWWVLENAQHDLQKTGIGGWFLSYLTPIGDTGYSISIQLGATQDSLRHPEAHARFLAMFQHLIESVRIDPLTPAIEAEIAQLKERAVEVQREDCIARSKRDKPPAWCEKYLSR